MVCVAKIILIPLLSGEVTWWSAKVRLHVDGLEYTRDLSDLSSESAKAMARMFCKMVSTNFFSPIYVLLLSQRNWVFSASEE